MNQNPFDICLHFIQNEYKSRTEDRICDLTELKSDDFRQSVLNKFKTALPFLDIKLDRPEEEYYESALMNFRCLVPITVEKSVNLSKGIDNWLTEDREKEAGWIPGNYMSFLQRYLKYLEKNGRTDKVIAETRRSSREIVRKLGDPRSSGSFYRRGMVVGSVQSGKTANFNAVINSSIDVGYELIIVFAGLMEDLRVQSQKRLELEVVGKWVRGQNYMGVGAIAPFGGPHPPKDAPKPIIPITSEAKDFTHDMAAASHSIEGRKLLVCKKNVSVLENLLAWLVKFAEEGKINVPLLVIDDEADNASINNYGYDEDRDPSKTNLLIRAILGLFDRKTYLGYTATPFANLLQYRLPDNRKYLHVADLKTEITQVEKFEIAEEIFPENFIELLHPPSNYFGIKSFFDTRQDDREKIEHLIEVISDDYEASIPPRVFKETLTGTLDRGEEIRAARKDDDFPTELPSSLKDAIDAFILSIALRYSRGKDLLNAPGYKKHHTMLIHVSRFSAWQNRLSELIKKKLEERQNQIIHSRRGEAVFADLERVWNNQFYQFNKDYNAFLPDGFEDPYLGYKSFSGEILPNLPHAVKKIEVVAVNSSKEGGDLKYGETEKKYIAIGGNRLSRGFTLEGLTVSYFLREAHTMDTLMQMGRWFGYRPGYIDACKLFTTKENIRKFNQASLVIEDLEQKFCELSKLPGRTPNDFTLWIQNNPDVIKLTRSNLLKGDLKKLTMNYGDSVKMATEFDVNQEKVTKLWRNFCKLASSKNWEHDEKNEFLICDTDQEGMLEFLDINTKNEGEAVMLNLDTTGLREFLEECAEKNALLKWKVAIRLGGTGKTIDVGSAIGCNSIMAKLAKRNGPKKGSKNSAEALAKDEIFRARNSTIMSSSRDFSLTLSEDQIVEAEAEFRKQRARELRKTKSRGAEDAFVVASKTKVPDKVYRSKMDDSTGLLVVYLIDYQSIFSDSVLKNFPEVKDYAYAQNYKEFNLPLVGYALGFPRVESVEGKDFIARSVAPEPYQMTEEQLKEIILRNELADDLGALEREDMIDLVSDLLL